MKQKTKMVLSYLDSHSNTATTHDLTLDTQLDNNQARHQLKKLRDLGYVELTKEREKNFTTCRAELTKQGKEKLKTDNFDRVTQNARFIADLIEDLDEKGVINKEDYL